MKDNYCVIMGGGIGSRFWPFSRESYPKQFLDFFGTGRSLLQMTFDRFSKIIPTENIFIVTNEAYADLIKEQLPESKENQISVSLHVGIQPLVSHTQLIISKPVIRMPILLLLLPII